MMSTARNNYPLPNSEESALARESASELSRLLSEKPDTDRAQVRMDGRDLILPRQAIALMRDLLAEMAQGHAVTVVPMHAELTTQEAADFLNVSRPYLIKLLEQGAIPYTKAGTHRRVRYQDLLDYRDVRDEGNRKALDALTEQAQEKAMGY